MKLLMMTFIISMVVGPQSYGQGNVRTIDIDPSGIVGLSMTYDPGDVGKSIVTEATPSKVVVYRDLTTKLRMPLLNNGEEKTGSLDQSTISELFMSTTLSFLRRIEIVMPNSFPCTGNNSVGSSGLPAANYFIMVKDGNLGKETKLSNGDTVKMVSFPALCFSNATKREFQEYFDAVGRVILLRSL